MIGVGIGGFVLRLGRHRVSSNMDHRKPAVAFALLAVVTAAVVGNAFRAKAESLDLWLAEEAPSMRAEGAERALPDRALRSTRPDRNGDRSVAPGFVLRDGLSSLPRADVADSRAVAHGLSAAHAASAEAPPGVSRAAWARDRDKDPKDRTWGRGTEPRGQGTDAQDEGNHAR